MEQKEFKPQTFQGRKSVIHENKWLNSFIANFFLLVLGFTASCSGLIIQAYYHVAHHSNTSTVLFLDHRMWNFVHVWVSAGFLLVVVYHVWLHRKWYRNILKKHLPPQNRPIVILTYIMIATTVSGFIPLCISFGDRSSFFRHIMIEIHDKIGVLFLIVVFFHTLKRFKWYANVIRKKF